MNPVVMHSFHSELSKIAGIEVEHGDVGSGTDRVLKATTGEKSVKSVADATKGDRNDKAVELARTYKGL